MPIYAYKCPKCGASRDEFNSIDERHTSAPVCECGARTEMQISPVRGAVKADCAYVCPASGVRVTSWQQRRNVMAEHGLVDARDIKPEFVFKKRAAERAELRREAAAMDLPDVDLTPYNPSVEERLAERQSH